MKNYNTDNLRPPYSPSEARENGRKGGLKSGESKRKKKEFREILEAAFDIIARDKDGNIVLNPDDKKRMSYREAVALKLRNKCLNGDLRAIELSLKITGELTETMNITADVSTQSDVVLGFDPMAAIRELYGKEGGDE